MTSASSVLAASDILIYLMEWRREWDSNPRGPDGPQALKAYALRGRSAPLDPHQRVNPLGPRDARTAEDLRM
ncbi:MAG TPA: hypothetical protein VFE96_09545, partial [Candidatus Bathyarchaeia archaeon]|nr:hypothetical protein [Candidatus Bathyarchaeia archaeon]